MPRRSAAPPTLYPEQRHLVARLERLADELAAGEHPQGVYVHGAVGRGKTWLCDAFFERVPTPAKRRVHFHSFFRQLQAGIWSQRTQDPAAAAHAVRRAVSSLLDGIDLLYFDEFHVHDSGNATLVLRVLDEVLARDVTLVATSNYAPQDLLPGPFHHVFERGIRLIEENLDVVQLGGHHDYRRTEAGLPRSGFAAGSWLSSESSAQLSTVGLTPPHTSEQRDVSAGGHRFTARRAERGQLWFSFAELCERDTAVSDYLHWVAEYDVWVIDGLPRLSDAPGQSAKRFANLIDVLCDRDVTLHVVSEHPRETMFEGTQLPLDSDRTASRLALLQAEQSSQPIHTQH